MDPLPESDLARLYRQNRNHDCGALTAYRSTCTPEENRARNRSLLAKLLLLNYSVWSLHGRCSEGDAARTCEGYFFVNHKDKGSLEADARALGKEFEQPSVLVMPKGAIDGAADAILIGTSHSPDGPGFGNREPFNNGRFSYDSPLCPCSVNGRPVVFRDVGDAHESPQTGFGMWALQVAARRPWQEFLE